ncbi:MAG: peptidoglycan-binding protein [Clostridia bacterium]|nr:peptidoglycan-binding protein [Clostridia bacterium]
MAVIYVYNPASNSMETYIRGLSEPMPYNRGNTLSVDEFRANSRANVIWTDRRTMDAWNATRSAWGRSIPVGFAFKRIWEGGHSPQSQHYAGTALDVAQAYDPATRNRFRNFAESLGVWTYVEPAYLTPTWVHVDKRTGVPACGAGFPTLAQGSVGVYVLVLQDALNAVGFPGAGLDGYFGPGTRDALMGFQRTQGLTTDGVAGCATWRALTSRAVGIGRTGTVID